MSRRAALITLIVARAASAVGVTVTDAMHKVRADDAVVPTGTSASIKAARNEFEAFQIVVRGPATSVSATASALTGPGGSITTAGCGAAGNIRLYREDLYAVGGTANPQSDVSGMTGRIPDALATPGSTTRRPS